MSVSDYYKSLSESQIVELRHCRSLTAALSTSAGAQSVQQLSGDWPEGEEAGVCVALCLMSMSHGSTGGDFVTDVARLSVAKSNGVCINESRFLKMIRANDWDSFLELATPCVRLIAQNNHGINRRSIEKFVRDRADSWANYTNDFVVANSTKFYENQSQSNEERKNQ